MVLISAVEPRSLPSAASTVATRLAFWAEASWAVGPCVVTLASMAADSVVLNPPSPKMATARSWLAVVGAVVPLEKALNESMFGSKAVGLGQALRDGLSVPPGIALCGAIVDAVASGEARAINEVLKWARPLGGPLAVRSSAADEDGASASFAGQHLTLLNVPSCEELVVALREVWWSANSDSAITYRKKVGLFTRPSIGVVVQGLLDPSAAGVMFTRNPVTGADERSGQLGVVAGSHRALVQPAFFRDSWGLPAVPLPTRTGAGPRR